MIFISYRISDSLDLVGRLEADLAREFGEEFVFRDMSRLDGGQDWTQELEDNARGCRVMLVVVGATWKSASFKDGDWEGVPRLRHPDDWVRKEITLALDAGNIVIPVFLNGTSLPSEGWLAHCKLDRLCRKQGEPLRSTADYPHDLAKLVTVLRKHCPELPGKPVGTTAPVLTNGLPAPPELYAVPNYILTSTFIGRASELDDLDAWAISTDPLMVVEGIGGLGKSALTWEWVQKRAAHAIPNLAGRVWWSFYERGANMAQFVRQALAYITGQNPAPLGKDTSHYQRCQELLMELKRRPFLLVLDGFERALTAYHRWDKAQQRDDRINATLRECVEPLDGELLQQLLHGSPSKVILSTRLFPSVLEDRASRLPMPGVAHNQLAGLSRPDALAYFRHASIQGSEQTMLEFADQFDRHSLLLMVVCGEIAQYPRRPFHFDAWRADPNYGGKLKLSELDLKQRYNHILHFALEGLDEHKRKLLCRISVISENVTYDTLTALNPYLPPKPKTVREPKDPKRNPEWSQYSKEKKQLAAAQYGKAREGYMDYRLEFQEYLNSDQVRQSVVPFDKALKELQDRGLLQWDRYTGQYDIHPVVRGHAADLLARQEKEQTFLTVRDHFAGLPPENIKKATELAHVAQSVEIYRCLVGAGSLDEAAQFYHGDLGATLFYRLGACSLIVELLTPLFHGRCHGDSLLASDRDQRDTMDSLACALSTLAHENEALLLYTKALRIDVDRANWARVSTGLRKYACSAKNLGRWAESSRALSLAVEVAEATGHPDRLANALYKQARDAVEQGRFADAERILRDTSSSWLPGREYASCLGQFYQGRLSDPYWESAYRDAEMN